MSNKNILQKTEKLNIYAYDVDYMGVVHNIVYLRWLETVRTNFLNEYYDLKDVMKTGITPIIAKTEATYIKPVLVNDEDVTACLRVEEIGRSRWIISMEVMVGDKVHFRADQVGMFYDMNKKKPARTPEHVRKIFQDALAD